jgi:DNA-directed RNA polymerase alpha subunit
MEFTVNTGKGYVAADKNRPEDAPIGLIPVDSDLFAGEEGVLQGRRRPARARCSTTTS